MRPLPRTLLVVDDEALFASALRDDLSSEALCVLTAGTGAEALRICRERRVDVILLDQRLPDASGPPLCPAPPETNEPAKIIFVTAFPNLENAMEAVRAGAFDYLLKPVELEQVRLAVNRCLKTIQLERKESVSSYRRGLEAGSTVLVGADGVLSDVDRMIRLSASVDSPVLVTGETGTGKGLVARAIHYASSRRESELVGVNCAALPENLIEAELFGYERGAFTGASSPREGLFEMAEGGTLFLDEIGEMPAPLQPRLLSVLEEKTVRRVGGRTFRTVDFRLVAATNADIEEAVRTRRMREDLFYRLNVIRIHLPPLRERPDLIPGLAAHFLRLIGGPDAGSRLSSREVEGLMRYPWPGNVRELRNVLERSLLLHRDGELRPSSILGNAGQAAPRPAPSLPSPATPLLSLAEVERSHIETVFAAAEGNLARAARDLGVSVSTLRRKLSATERRAVRSRTTGRSGIARSI